MKQILLIISFIFLFSCENKIILNDEENNKENVEITDTNIGLTEDCLNYEIISKDARNISINVDTNDYFILYLNNEKPILYDKPLISLNKLKPDTNYTISLLKLDKNTKKTCLSEEITLKTDLLENYKSCHEIKELNPSSETGYYDIYINDEIYSVFCYMSENEGWTRVFYHNVNEGFFYDKEEALLYNKEYPEEQRYSILQELDDLKDSSEFIFYLRYPEMDLLGEGNFWKQSSNPLVSSIENYEGISIKYSQKYWGGLELSSSASTLIDGSVNHSNWFYAIGTVHEWNEGIPGPFNSVEIVELYIK